MNKGLKVNFILTDSLILLQASSEKIWETSLGICKYDKMLIKWLMSRTIKRQFMWVEGRG